MWPLLQLRPLSTLSAVLLLLQEGLPFCADTFLGTTAEAVEEDVSLGEQICAICCICCDQPQSDREGGKLSQAPLSCYAKMHSCYFCFNCYSSPGTQSLESVTGLLPLPQRTFLASVQHELHQGPNFRSFRVPSGPLFFPIKQSQTQFSFTKSRPEGQIPRC